MNALMAKRRGRDALLRDPGWARINALLAERRGRDALLRVRRVYVSKAFSRVCRCPLPRVAEIWRLFTLFERATPDRAGERPYHLRFALNNR
jgi:hypothetical protein